MGDGVVFVNTACSGVFVPECVYLDMSYKTSTSLTTAQGWREVLQRYIAGKGVIYDYEFLNNPDGNNVGAGMSPFAGFVGCAVVCFILFVKTAQVVEYVVICVAIPAIIYLHHAYTYVQGLQAWCAQHLFPDAPLAPVVVSTKAKLCEALREQIDEIQNIKVRRHDVCECDFSSTCLYSSGCSTLWVCVCLDVHVMISVEVISADACVPLHMFRALPLLRCWSWVHWGDAAVVQSSVLSALASRCGIEQ